MEQNVCDEEVSLWKHEHFKRERTLAQVETPHIVTAVVWRMKKNSRGCSTFSFLRKWRFERI